MTGRTPRPAYQPRPHPSGPSRPVTAGIDFPVVGLGASAGGLEAFKKLFDALPATCGMAFVLIQHLDPNHQSMMVDLLAGHTRMTVVQAADGMPVEIDLADAAQGVSTTVTRKPRRNNCSAHSIPT